MLPKNNHGHKIRSCFFLTALVTTIVIASITIMSMKFGLFTRGGLMCGKPWCYGSIVYDGFLVSSEDDEAPPTGSLGKNTAAAADNNDSRLIFKFTTDKEAEGWSERHCGYFVAHNPFQWARLGNQMFTYASFYGTWSKSAKRVGKTTFIQLPAGEEKYARVLPDAFGSEHLSLLPYQNYSQSWYTERNFTGPLHEYMGGGRYYQEQLLENTSCDGTNVMMRGFRQSFKYFSNVAEEIRREFTFKESVKRAAERLLDETLMIGGGGGQRRGDCVLIGVHMRRGDFGEEWATKFGFTMADEAYLKEAVTFFQRIYLTPYQKSKLPQQRSKFWWLTFLIFGNDYEWNANASRVISPNNNKTHVIAVDNRNSSAAVDMCALSMLCDHVVQSTGTFSWWAGFLSRGIVIYKAEYATPGTEYFNGIKPDDYFLPHWIPL